jgi:hypothetical protein
VFSGDVLTSWNSIQQPDIVTRIKAQDGEKATKTKKASLSYKKGASAKAILKDAIKKFATGHKGKTALDVVKDVVYNIGYSHVGDVQAVLDKMTDDLGLVWSVQDGNILTAVPGKKTAQGVISLTSATGLLRSPERITDVRLGGRTVKGVDGWRVYSLLSPSIIPGDLISVTSRELTGENTLQVISIEHAGDTHGQEWATTMDTVPV